MHLVEERKLIDRGEWRPPDQRDAVRRLTLSEWATEYVESRSLAPGTYRNYTRMVRVYVEPSIGRKYLADITVTDVSSWHASLKADLRKRSRAQGRTNGDGAGEAAQVYNFISGVFKAAASVGLIDASPARLVGAGRYRRHRTPLVLTTAEVEALAQALPERFRALADVLSWTGLRLGEVRALRRRDINLPVVRALFSEDVRPTGHYGKISRHGVHHGRDLGYATRVNSTKTIVLVAALAEYLPKIADDAGAQLRRQHEDEVAGSTEIDELGRVVDDRHVPELLRFAHDFDTEYLNAVLLHLAPFNARRQLATIAHKHGLDPEAFALDEDQLGWRWHYTIPAGQTLGYAARPSTSNERRHPDVWRWDGPSTPDTFPWNDTTGWRSDDDPPRSPNWEPRPVI